MKDFIKTYWFGLFVLVFIAGCTSYNLYFSHQKELQRLQKELDNEKQERRKQHIEDSIKATPAYIDSVRKSEKLFSDWENKLHNLEKKEIVGFVFEDDTIYHSCFHTVHQIYHPAMPLYTNFLDIDAEYLRFVTKREVEDLRLYECTKCSEIISAYNDYEDGELIRKEDARDYVDDY